jgi:hypothetical protein
VKKALVFADPEKMSFQANAVVAAAADSLYQAIVDSIEDLILLTTNEKSTCKNDWKPRLAGSLKCLCFFRATHDVEARTQEE